jgi:hypothetical protein
VYANVKITAILFWNQLFVKFLIPYEQLYIQSHHHHHKQLITEQNSGEYIPMYQLVYDQQVMPHNTKPPDPHPHSQAQ